MFGNLIIGAFVVGVMASPHCSPRRMGYGESRVDIAKLTVQKFANEAYPQWHRAHGADCPRSLYELTEFMDRVTTLDPWGRPYRLACSNDSSWRSPIRVWSIGEDGIPNTFDDLRSWD
jgi:hypothetical protein